MPTSKNLRRSPLEHLLISLRFRVLLRVRMLYYIKHEIIGDYVQQIQDGIPIRYERHFCSRNFSNSLIVHQLIRNSIPLF